MEPHAALQTAAALLAIAALGGLVMAAIRLRGAPRPPSSIALLHGLLAAAALTLLVYFALTTGIPPMAQLATVVLVVAALGGAFINLRFHAQMQPLPVGLMFGHAGLAAVGFILLLVAVFQGPPAIGIP